MKKLLLIVITCSLCSIISAQSVGIGTNDPDSSAALEITSVTQGILVPRMTTAQRAAISNPATGLLVFDMTSSSFWFRSSTQWVELVDTANTVVHKNGPDIYAGMIGKVGIGTSTPSSKLEVKTLPGQPGITHTDGTVTMQTNTTPTASTINTITNHSLQLNANNGTNQFTISPSGNIGIGIASAAFPLNFPQTTGDKIAFYGNGGTNFGIGMAANMMQMFTPNASGAIGFGYGNSTSFTENMRLTGDGRLGIGTNSPSEKLSVTGNANFSGNLTIGGALAVAGGIAVGGGVGFTHTDGNISMGTKLGSDYGKVTTFTNHSLQLSANDMTNQMTLTTNGNVGIGTDMPAAKLDVKTPSDVLGIQYGDEIIKVGGKVGSGIGKLGTITNHSMQLSANDLADQLTLATNGNVGVGTDAPLTKFEVKTPSDVQGIQHSDGIIKMATKVGSGIGKLGTVTSHPMQLSANDLADQLTLATNGNVGVGTDAPLTKFEVKTPSGVQGIQHSDGIIKMATKVGSGIGKLGTVTSHPMQLSANDLADQLTLATNGNVGVGTDAPLTKFEVKTPSGVQGIQHSDGIIKMATKVGSGIGKLGTVTSHPMQLSANDLADQLTLATNGNVGVGTDAPLTKFEVRTPSNVQGIQHSDGIVKMATKVGSGRGKFGTVTSHPLELSANDLANQLTLATNGNVGVGISSPTASLEVARGAGVGGTAAFKGTTHASHFNYSTDEHTYIRGGKANSHVILNDLAGSGNVGVGTTVPLQKLHIEGGAYVSGNEGVGISNPQNKVDIHNGSGRSVSARTGTHPTGLPLYVTGDIMAASEGIELRHSNGTQGIGLGFNTMYAAGSNTDQDLGLSAKGLGSLIYKTNQSERMRINGNGNVGIGTSTPNAPLQFANTIANRKLVLWESTNNDHQFYGLGINGSTLRYQVSFEGDKHAFYAGASPTTSNELMRIQGNGNVGIGNGAPTEKLNVGSYSTPANTYMQVGTSGGNQYKAGIKLKHHSDAWGWTMESDETQGKFFIKRHIDDPTGIAAMTVNGYSGNVGIGTSSPNAPLQFANSSQNRKIVMYENANNDHQFNGLGAEESIMRYQVGNAEYDHVFYSATSSSASNELMRVKGNGDVDVAGSVLMGYYIEQDAINLGPNTYDYELVCDCPPNTKVLGGGWYGQSLDTYASRPNASGSAWLVKCNNVDPLFSHVLTVYAICARMGN